MNQYDESIDDTFSSPFLKAADLPDEGLAVEISEVDFQIFGKGADREKKPILSLDGHNKMLVLNKTNARTIAKVVGSPRYAEWVGKRITLVRADVEFAGDMVEAIRVKSR